MHPLEKPADTPSEKVNEHTTGWRRRDVLKLGATGLAGLSLGGPLSARAIGVPTAVRPARNLILILCVGGPSQLETWDPKPEAPAEIRGPYGAIETSVPGLRISETLPRLARLAHNYALVRSVHHDAPALHELGWQALQTGSAALDAPDLPHVGSVLAQKSRPSADVTPFVVLPHRLRNDERELAVGQSAGWLGTDCQPVSGADLQKLAPRTRAALDLSPESARQRDRYGRHPLGAACLSARRLIESGTRTVVVNQFSRLFNRHTWDCHAYPQFPTRVADLKDAVAAPFDQAVSALIEDLQQRGLYEETLVCCFGEFGRTPRLTETGGRDHWTRCWSVMLGGGGLAGGQVIGASDAHAADPTERPVTPATLVATLYAALGIDPSSDCVTAEDTRLPLFPPATEPIADLLSLRPADTLPRKI